MSGISLARTKFTHTTIQDEGKSLTRKCIKENSIMIFFQQIFNKVALVLLSVVAFAAAISSSEYDHKPAYPAHETYHHKPDYSHKEYEYVSSPYDFS